MLSSGHEHSFICSLRFNVITVLKKNKKQKGMFVLNTAFVGRHGAVVIIFKSSSIFCRNCVLLKGHCSSIYLRKSEHLDTSSSNICSLMDMSAALSVA